MNALADAPPRLTPRARAAALACWSGKVDPAPLAGGITNANFVVEDNGRKCVVRIGDDIPVHHIVRANELAASRAAHAAGLSPAVIHAEPGALVLDFIDGRSFTAEEVRADANRDALADLLRRCHREIPNYLRGSAAMFWVFHVLRDYAHTLRDGASSYMAIVPRLLGQAEQLEAGVGPVEIVFGHNDLLAANILDDGKRLWLIDWDYAGFNSPLFDLGGLISNSQLDSNAADEMLALYCGRAANDELRCRLAAMSAASLLRETMWSMVSEIHSRLAFDYAGYTADNLRRYDAAYAAFLTMR